MKNARLLFIILLAAPSFSYAWGFATHIYHGSFILLKPHFLIPEAAFLISSYSLDFIYGLICADFFIGKGEKVTEKHCHRWQAGKDLVAMAETNSQKAFALGHLSHLSADVIAHNYFIPIFLHYQLFLLKKMKHVYWEALADSLVPHHLTSHIETVLSHDHREHDKLLNQALGTNLTVYKVRKYVFKKSVDIQNNQQWKNRLQTISSKKYHELVHSIRYFQRLSLSCIFDVLNRGETSALYDFDPIGEENLKHYKTKKILINKAIIDIKDRYYDEVFKGDHV